MKINKWTLGLAAVGLVSLTPALRAQTAPTPVAMPALSATTISGYVDTSAVWSPGTGNANPAPYAFNGGKADGFNLDAVDVKISKPLDESQWAAGYTLELMYGPNANQALGTWAPLRQAFVDLRANFRNGLDFKMGEWDNLLGYEGTDAMNNGNWTRSYGYSMEPTEHIGLLAAYPFSSLVNLQVGVADELSTGYMGYYPYNNRNLSGLPPAFAGPNTYVTIESKKALVSLLTLTAPDSWGALAKSRLDAGIDYGPGNAFSHPGVNAHIVDKTELYVGATIMTPVKGLKVGASWDSINNSDLGPVEGYATAYAVYLHFAVPDTKITLDTRAEYARGSALDNMLFAAAPSKAEEAKVFAVTQTLDYKLWGDNVISRLEARWDSSADGSHMFGGTLPGVPTKNNELMIGANVIYKF
jgi:hypothetical protein